MLQHSAILLTFKGEHSAKFLTFIKLSFVIETFVLSIFEWPFYTGFTVYGKSFEKMIFLFIILT